MYKNNITYFGKIITQIAIYLIVFLLNKLTFDEEPIF